MRTNNKNVARAWHNGEFAQSHNGNYHTDGRNLYSYRMLIGVTAPDGTKYLLNVRGKNGYSSTTSKHVRLASVGATLVEPVCKNNWRYFPVDTMKELVPGYLLSEYGSFLSE